MSYFKYGAIAALVIALFGFGWYGGHLEGSAAVARLQRDQAQITATAVLAERASTQAETNRLRKLVADYEASPIDPIVPGIASRLYKYTLASRAVSCAPTNTPGSSPTSPVPAGDPILERLSQAAFDAAAHDAKELTALQSAWPKP